MLLGIDGNEANVENRVGSNVYAYEILRYLHRNTESGKYTCRVYLKQFWKTLLPPKSDSWQYSVVGPGMLWTQWRFPLQLYTEKLVKQAPNIIFSPGHYAPRFSPVPTVITIMDLAFFKFPEDFRTRDLRKLHAWTRYSVQQASHIFAISQSTKDDIVKYYDIDPKKITVTYLGLSAMPGKLEKDNSFQHISTYLGITKPYLLYIGTLQPRKNIVRLIEAFAELKKSVLFSQLKLVIVGKKGWLYQEIFNKIQELKITGEVVFTGFVSDYEKIELLKHAQLLVLPSLYEGFGFPVLEAMSLGTPVVVSRVSSLPEVGGEAVCYIEDPHSMPNIKESIAKVLQLSQNERLEMIAKGHEQAKTFTWDACGRKTLEVLLNMNENRK